MKNKVSVFAMLCILGVTFMLLTVGCNVYTPQTSKSGASQADNFFKVPKNSKGNTCEQQNIFDRLKVTTDPTKILWNHLIALDGSIIKRMPVKCKITSSGKRLEPKHAATASEHYLPNSGFLIPGRTGEHDNDYYRTDEFIGIDGTYGNSDDYVYWFDPFERYHQYGTAGGIGYLLTDYPIDLKNPIDEMTGLYNMHEAARKWQLEQEDILKETEVKEKKVFDKKMKDLQKTIDSTNANQEKEGE